jgi:hypothetical protein
MPTNPTITPEEALDFVNSIIKRADDQNCETDGLCPLYDFCRDEVCVMMRKVLTSAKDSTDKEKVKP